MLCTKIGDQGNFIFPAVKGNMIANGSMVYSNFVDMLNTASVSSRHLDTGTKGFSGHSFRRGGIQDCFLFADPSTRWTVDQCKNWGGWSLQEGPGACLAYIVNEIEYHENFIGDMRCPWKTHPKAKDSSVPPQESPSAKECHCDRLQAAISEIQTQYRESLNQHRETQKELSEIKGLLTQLVSGNSSTLPSQSACPAPATASPKPNMQVDIPPYENFLTTWKLYQYGSGSGFLKLKPLKDITADDYPTDGSYDAFRKKLKIRTSACQLAEKLRPSAQGYTTDQQYQYFVQWCNEHIIDPSTGKPYGKECTGKRGKGWGLKSIEQYLTKRKQLDDALAVKSRSLMAEQLASEKDEDKRDALSKKIQDCGPSSISHVSCHYLKQKRLKNGDPALLVFLEKQLQLLCQFCKSLSQIDRIEEVLRYAKIGELKAKERELIQKMKEYQVDLVGAESMVAGKSTSSVWQGFAQTMKLIDGQNSMDLDKKKRKREDESTAE